MKVSLRTVLPLLFTLAVITTPLLGFAAPNSNPTDVPTFGNSNPTAAPVFQNQNPTAAPCTGSNCSLENPLRVGNFCTLLKVVLDALIVIGLPIAVVFLIIVGFKFILAQGNQEKLSTARSNFLHTVIGIAIFLGAWTIAKLISATLAGLGVTGINQC